MRRPTGVLLLVAAVVVGAVGGTWAALKALGAEVDYCRGSGCASGWYPALGMLAVATVAALAGVALLRQER